MGNNKCVPGLKGLFLKKAQTIRQIMVKIKVKNSEHTQALYNMGILKSRQYYEIQNILNLKYTGAFIMICRAFITDLYTDI